jgi:ferrous iron transport protein A
MQPNAGDQIIKLSELPIGQKAVIHSFTNLFLKLQLLEMGCIPGEEVKVIMHAPLGCPVAIQVGGSTLSLRISEAHTVLVVKQV